ncbi:MFS transporter [Streptomyces sp. NPDC088246]|uniref:MFS transporter n=1 Tax=Streptomyces sp. NPDC088246 TaxID=3365842 RepID=UPI00382362B5
MRRSSGMPSGGSAPPGHIPCAHHVGRRYVWNVPGVRRVLLRTLLFIRGGAALWALLPWTASRSLGLGSGAYGLLLGSVGVGAVVGAFALPRLRRVLGANGTLAAGAVVFAGVLAVLATVRAPWPVAVALLPAGPAWIAVLSTLNAAVQARLPGWVRARGLAVCLLVFQGGQVVAAPLWGAVADWRLGGGVDGEGEGRCGDDARAESGLERVGDDGVDVGHRRRRGRQRDLPEEEFAVAVVHAPERTPRWEGEQVARQPVGVDIDDSGPDVTVHGVLPAAPGRRA